MPNVHALTARQCYRVMAGQRDDAGYIPSVITEGVRGHSPLTGNGPGAQPWHWGPSWEQAKAQEAEANADLGLTSEDVFAIVASSMR